MILKQLRVHAPLEVELYILMGELYTKMGDTLSAFKAYTAASEVDLNDPRVISALEGFSSAPH